MCALSGPLDREGTSLAGGIVRFLNLRGGDYRLRFAHPKFVLLERDVTMRPGASQTVERDALAGARGAGPERRRRLRRARRR